jgi:hypothetical protein
MANLYHALERYLVAVFDVVESKQFDPERVIIRSRATRLAWMRAESAIGRAVAEPTFARADPVDGRSQLATTMRILRALHAIRIEAERGLTIEPSRELDDLIEGLASALRTLYDNNDEEVRSSRTGLRSLYRVAVNSLKDPRASEPLVIHLDELVNAINTATELAEVPND